MSLPAAIALGLAAILIALREQYRTTRRASGFRTR